MTSCLHGIHLLRAHSGVMTPCLCRSEQFYDKLQNSIGGGKPKMRWYFGESPDLQQSLMSDTLILPHTTTENMAAAMRAA